ncbi:MAG: hypothetical protein WCP12_08940 [bacterium]
MKIIRGLLLVSALYSGAVLGEAPITVERPFTEMSASLRAKLPKLLVVRRKNGYGLRGTNATMFSRRTGMDSSIEVIDPQNPNALPQVLFWTDKGFIWDIDVSWDGTKILFTYKANNESPFHLWEMNADGSNPRQLTDGRYHDFNGIYYPDGRIVFASSRVEAYSYCQDFLASALYVCKANGSDIRRIDYTTLCSMKPSVMNDGSILFTRWEYNDKNIFMWQGLWTILPDGRQLQLYYGNTINVPNSRYGGRAIPGTGDVMLTMAAHHHPPIADIAVLTRSKGIENPDALRKVTSETPYIITGSQNYRDIRWGPGDSFHPWSVTDPYPLEDNLFLASFGNEKNPSEGFKLCVAQYDGTRYVMDFAGKNVFSVMPLRERPLPRSITRTEISKEKGDGTFYVQDVYQGLEAQGVKRGQVKSLRVMKQLPKTQNTEGPRYHDHYPIVGYGTYYTKEILGEVPVYENGSVYFRAPSNCELYFIALDKEGKEIQRMGSVTQITAGERAACVGCHEPRLSAPPTLPTSMLHILRRPNTIKPPLWGAGRVDYVKIVQPVLDRYCVSCHSGPTPPNRVDLSGDKTRFFNMSYDTLCERRLIEYYYINPGPTGVFPAMKTGSMVSRLTKMLEDKHKDVNVDAESRRRIYAWIDSNVIYYPSFDMTRPYTQGGRDTFHALVGKGRGPLKQHEWVIRLNDLYSGNCLACHGPLVEADVKKMQWINLTRPENSRLLNAHLSKEAGGYGFVGKRKEHSDFSTWKSKKEPVYLEMLSAIMEGKRTLEKTPREDMSGAVIIPQERDSGRTF